MIVVSLLASIAYTALLLYLVVMWARFILDVVQSINRRWRPTGFMLVLANIVYTLTDRPIRFVRRIVPSVRLGGVALDFGWSIVMLAVLLLMAIVGSLR
ncbi:MAG: hypothetical protein JWP30_104 [Homoserinimonas sp.]|jgi:YggT family protein|nr:hypothetical protein [Homoserinimonas sp.]